MERKNPILGALIWVAVAIALAVIIYTVPLMFGEKPAQEEIDPKSFSAGVVVVVEMSAIADMYGRGLISEETYKELMEEVENCIKNPSIDNIEKWRNLCKEKIRKQVGGSDIPIPGEPV